MVSRIKIHKGETPLEELQQAFNDEMKDILKDAALRLQCSVHELKCRVDNMGQVEVKRMSIEEMNQRSDEISKQKLRKAILERKRLG